MTDTARGARTDGPASSETPNAACLSITEDILNDLILVAVGEGRPVEPMEQPVTLPGMGEVRLRLALTITGGRFDLRPDDGGLARVTVTADGDVSVLNSDYEGDTVASGPLGMPAPPAPIPVAVVALVRPFLVLRDDDSATVGLDLTSSSLVSLGVDHDAPVPEGVDPTAWSGITQMIGMMFATLGEGLWVGLVDHVGAVDVDLPAEVGAIMYDLGIARGPAQVGVASGVLSFALPARPGVTGRADPVPVAGKKVGIGLAGSAVDRGAQLLVERVIGGLPIPFEIDVELAEQQVGGRLRQTRLWSDRFPDLRAALRTEVRPRLSRGRLEVAVMAAWVELPAALPGFLNGVNRRLGSIASMIPYRFRFPATIDVPIGPDPTDRLPVHVDDLRVSADGVGVVLALD